MKRFHVHLSVDNLAHNIRFYSAMFGVAPTVEKADYAKWMLDDPRVNFAISARGRWRARCSKASFGSCAAAPAGAICRRSFEWFMDGRRRSPKSLS